MSDLSAEYQPDTGRMADSATARAAQIPASQNPDPPTDHWAVCQVFSKRATRIQSEAEGKGCGGFLPTYDFVRYSAGKRSSGTRQLLPGYLFVKVRPEDRAGIAELEGVYRILPGGTRALAQLEAEMSRLVVGYVTRAWDEREAMPAGPRRRRRRRPRPGRRMRAAAEGRPCVGAG